MTNYERIISEGTDGLVPILANTNERCEYCNYDKLSCGSKCLAGITEWLNSEPKHKVYVVLDVTKEDLEEASTFNETDGDRLARYFKGNIKNL